ncbi:hypothetical protein HNP46_006315 [Pseudomonas nitritireducens]|uniref:Uncharacterized protein n=1 Tax=Pseudomonas nitroreducens TaxID=46680 RepID=A0A7W7KR20_PSENT|nr:hypothetical protein [Pseudomonas nitritireducens]MBB4867402.1 hypothetical protein [Pseudomonas nitritireducens]
MYSIEDVRLLNATHGVTAAGYKSWMRNHLLAEFNSPERKKAIFLFLSTALANDIGMEEFDRITNKLISNHEWLEDVQVMATPEAVTDEAELLDMAREVLEDVAAEEAESNAPELPTFLGFASERAVGSNPILDIATDIVCSVVQIDTQIAQEMSFNHPEAMADDWICVSGETPETMVYSQPFKSVEAAFDYAKANLGAVRFQTQPTMI